MVSQPERSQALTLRGPSSVVSRNSVSRHRRHGRSHAGGSHYTPQNDFPIFSQSGDVEILVKVGGKENRYVLHRLILTQCSGFFEASTSEEWSKGATDRGGELARIGEDGPTGDLARIPNPDRKKWRYELDSGTEDDDVPMLVQKEPTAVSSLFGNSNGPPPVRNKPSATDPSSFFRSVTNLASHAAALQLDTPLSPEDEDLLRDYDNLFLIFYNYSPTLSAVDIALAYTQCKSLLSLADMYDALPVVGPRIEHHLLQFRSRLWKQIAKYPASYCKLGYLSRSKIIFSEALVHVVGQWPVGERGLRNSLPNAVLDLIEDKVDELADTITRVEAKLFRLSLSTPRGEQVTPSNSFLDWLVVSFFRQWLADNTSNVYAPPPPPPPPATSHSSRSHRSHGGQSSQVVAVGAGRQATAAPPAAQLPNLISIGPAYRIIGGPAAAFLNHNDCKKFLKLTPELYTRDNMRKFERRLDDLKAMARDIVRPLMKSMLELDGMTTSSSLNYLTCTRIEDRDLPWDD